MTSLISPTTLSTFTPILSKPTAPFSLFPYPCNKYLSNFLPYQNPKSLLAIRCLQSFASSSPDGSTASRCLQTEQPSQGEIHVIVGPMFAGKTTTLLRRIRSESCNGSFQARVLNDFPDMDETLKRLRFSGRLAEAVGILCRRGMQLEVIGIDEAQFFEDLYDFCIKAADDDGKTVIVAGLDGDYLRRSFGSVLDIIPIADSITKLNAQCELCDKPAFFTLRKTEEAQTELIAGADVYMPVCRKHYMSGQVVKEAARTVLETRKVQCGSLL